MSKLSTLVLSTLNNQGIAFYSKGKQGSWRPHSKQALLRLANTIATNLTSLKITQGSRICCLINSTAEMVALDIATFAMGAVLVPLLPFQSADEINYVISETDPDLIILSEKNQKTLPVTQKYSCLSLEDITAKTSTHGVNLQTLTTKVKDEQDALITYTSGTTGAIKGCIHTHSALYSQVTNFLEEFNQTFTKQRKVLLFQLPGGIWFHLLVLQCLASNCPFYLGALDHYLADLKSVKPHIVPVYSTILHQLYQKVITTTSHPDEQQRLLLKLLGGNCHCVFAAASPSTSEALRFYQSAKLTYYNIYASTETMIISIARTEKGVGKLFQGVKIKFYEDGEILIKSPSIFSRYLNDNDRTQNAFINGWYATGDLGKLDSAGNLILLGRKKEIYKSAFGASIYPTFIEDKLNACPTIHQSCVVGDNKPYLVALITLQKNATRAEKNTAEKKVKTHLTRINSELSDIAKIKKYVILHKPFTQKSGEITPYLKIIRRKVQENNQAIIENLYSTA